MSLQQPRLGVPSGWLIAAATLLVAVAAIVGINQWMELQDRIATRQVAQELADQQRAAEKQQAIDAQRAKQQAAAAREYDQMMRDEAAMRGPSPAEQLEANRIAQQQMIAEHKRAEAAREAERRAQEWQRAQEAYRPSTPNLPGQGRYGPRGGSGGPWSN